MRLEYRTLGDVWNGMVEIWLELGLNMWVWVRPDLKGADMPDKVIHIIAVATKWGSEGFSATEW